MSMGACDAHGAVWMSELQMSPGEGYLLDARFMQQSVIQEKLLDRDMRMMASVGISRAQYRAQVEAMQGYSPWLICDQCIRLLKLGQADLDAAREAAQRWWTDKSTRGHLPGRSAAPVVDSFRPTSTSVPAARERPVADQAELSRKLAIASLVLNAAAIPLSCTGFGVLLPVLAVPLGAIAFVKARQSDAPRNTLRMALGGMIAGCVLVVALAAVLVASLSKR
jgi:hypothetical protein